MRAAWRRDKKAEEGVGEGLLGKERDWLLVGWRYDLAA